MEAISQKGDSVLLDLYVKPDSNITEILGYNKWRKRIEVKISSPARKGEANDELIATFSNLLSVSKKNVAIKRGKKRKNKTLLVKGKNLDRVEEVLEDIS